MDNKERDIVVNLSYQSNQQRAADPVYRKLHRAFFAVCILLAPLTLSLWFGLCPQYGDPACPNNTNYLAILVAYRAANLLSVPCNHRVTQHT